MENKTEERVRYADTDSFGVVYYGSYYRWAEGARADFIRKFLGKSLVELENEDCIFPVVNVNADYEMPGRYDDIIEISTSVVHIGNSSIKFSQIFSGPKGVLCRIETVCVCVSKDMVKKRVPDELRGLSK